MDKLTISCFVFICIIGLSVTEIVKFTKCPGDSASSNCVIQQVRIDPCPEAIDDNPCKIKRGKTATIEFDFKADFEATKPQAQVYWASEIDIPFSGMDTDACNSTPCPIRQNTNQTYTYTMQTLKKFPARNFDIKWVLTGDSPTDVCCFKSKIRIAK